VGVSVKVKLHVISLACALGVASMPSYAQFNLLGSVISGVTSGVSSALGQVGSKITGGEKPTDIQAERDKVFMQLEKQIAGMDPDTANAMRQNMEKTWSKLEFNLLMRNANIEAQKDAPLVDFGKVARDALGSAASTAGMQSAMGGNGLGSILQTAAIDGVAQGVGANSNASSMHVQLAGHSVSDIGQSLQHGANAVAASGVKSSVSNVVAGLTKGKENVSSTIKVTEKTHPLRFFGKHPEQVDGSALYREKGFLGWRRVEAAPDGSAQAYAPVAGKWEAKAAVFNIDPVSGKLTAAFRVIDGSAVDFMKAVEGYTQMLGSEPTYASVGATVRAVWPTGAFVAADEHKLTAGWSRQVRDMFSQRTASN